MVPYCTDLLKGCSAGVVARPLASPRLRAWNGSIRGVCGGLSERCSLCSECGHPSEALSPEDRDISGATGLMDKSCPALSPILRDWGSRGVQKSGQTDLLTETDLRLEDRFISDLIAEVT